MAGTMLTSGNRTCGSGGTDSDRWKLGVYPVVWPIGCTRTTRVTAGQSKSNRTTAAAVAKMTRPDNKLLCAERGW